MININFLNRKILLFITAVFFISTGHVSMAMAAESSTPSIVETNKPLRVLIEPGHEPNFGGTAFRGMKERDLTVELGTLIQNLLADDPHFQVVMTRDTKSWNPIFNDYFRKNWKGITSWQKATKKTFLDSISKGIIQKPISKVGHNKAPTKVATRLFGMNKWANENNMDIVLNIHFDDENSHRRNVQGRYSGFVIYQPSPQYNNSKISQKLAKNLLVRLKEVSSTSNLPGQKGGIIDEPKLIAVGENNTSNAASLVIEYGFIYEKKFTDRKLRTKSLEDLAAKTYEALEDYRVQRE